MIIWYSVMLILLYMMTNIVTIMVLWIIMLPFSYWGLIVIELMVIVFWYVLIVNGSSYERQSAISYLVYYGFVLSMVLVIVNSLEVITVVVVILGLANLPLYGLHTWLPKVHSEASIISSIVLAGAVLKIGILYLWNFSTSYLFVVLLLGSLAPILMTIDGKVFIAYSSVLHISCCVIVGLVVISVVSYTHIVISPLLFMIVYISYNNDSIRYYMNMGLLVFILLILNFGFPLVSGFISELYIMSYNGSVLLVIIVIYWITSMVLLKSINGLSSGLIYVPLIIGYLLIS